ncbi:MAG: hypothetical protein WB696_07330 [Chthoniobacterales bacterium]
MRLLRKDAQTRLAPASIVDLTILATGKYLIDFYGFSRSELFLVTIDKELYHLAKSYPDVPRAFNPTLDRDSAQKVFCG